MESHPGAGSPYNRNAMSVGRVRLSRRRCASAFALVAAIYALLLGVGELQHHDLACHLKSRTHCTACISGVSGPGLAAAQQPTPHGLQPVGRVDAVLQPFALAPALAGSQGRSPPAA